MMLETWMFDGQVHRWVYNLKALFIMGETLGRKVNIDAVAVCCWGTCAQCGEYRLLLDRGKKQSFTSILFVF